MDEMIDYRLSSGEVQDALYASRERKNEFMIFFRSIHPRAKNIYSYVHNRNLDEASRFRKLYSNKCAYCGVNTKVIESSRFEVDHFIPQSILDGDTDKRPSYLKDYNSDTVNGISNLVCACQTCNKWKRDFFFNMEENSMLAHPDNEHFHGLFKRQDDFSITISEDYMDNTDINKFYKSLRLNEQLRRLDFFMMEINDFLDELPKNDPMYIKISTFLIKIDRKRKEHY